MASFKDRLNRDWQISITVATIKRVKETCGVNLGLLLHDEMKLLNEVISNPESVANVVYSICKPEADRIGITDDQFGEALAGESMGDCVDAFIEAVIDFFPQRQSRMLKLVVKKTAEMQDALAEAVEKKLESEMKSTLTKLVSDLQESSE